jgi:DNA-binding HxlR family transcriptional regulator
MILWLLGGKKRRFNDLQAAMPGIRHKVLTHQLRELQRDGIVTRIVADEPRLRVDYALTDFGATLRPILDAMASWAKRTIGGLARRFCQLRDGSNQDSDDRIDVRLRGRPTEGVKVLLNLRWIHVKAVDGVHVTAGRLPRSSRQRISNTS